MAQGRVTDYYGVRKSSNFQSSKRRKLHDLTDIDFASTVFGPGGEKTSFKRNTNKELNIESERVRSRSQAGSASPEVVDQRAPAVGLTRQRTVRASQSTVCRRNKAKAGSHKLQQDAKLMADIFLKKTPQKTRVNEQDGQPQQSVHVPAPAPTIEETTSSMDDLDDLDDLDDHAPSLLVTPQTHTHTSEGSQEVNLTEETIERKRKRATRTSHKDKLNVFVMQTPERGKSGYDFGKFNKGKIQKSVRKRLVLKPSEGNEQCEPRVNETENAVTDDTPTAIATPTPCLGGPRSSSNTPLMDRIKTVFKDKPRPICEDQSEVNLQLDKDQNLEPSHSGSSKHLKSKLAKCGNLNQLQQCLANFNQSAAKLQSNSKQKKHKTEQNAAHGIPAYEKYHNLAEAVPPTLALPYKYKLLSEMFRSTETVVSLLHNRAEVCTFTKLKTAVQQIMRKTFEDRHLGQIKTIHPTAYYFRQDHALSAFGKKLSGYELTIEPWDSSQTRSESDQEYRLGNCKVLKSLNASTLVQRRTEFHNCLIDIVKQHHKEFLSKLDRPLKVPDDKITRWHPNFPLDQIPDVEPSSLPKPQNVSKVTSANDVLLHASGKLPTKMQQALENVGKPSSECHTENGNKAISNETCSSSAIKRSDVKGISASLLERIRAKEAKKLEEAMTRNPAEDKRTEMIGRLGEMARILRSFYVKQKKISLTLIDAMKIITDSYHSAISEVEVESHIKLLAELCPNFMTLMKVRHGQYLKIDKNQDMNQISAKLAKMSKQ